VEETTPRTDSDRSVEGDSGSAGKASGGLLLVDKPAGITSHDAVQRIRQIYGERSIGHLGTLDPFATGLLVLLIGRATRLATFLDTEPKVYDATITFGSETDTDDATGSITRTGSLPREADVRASVRKLTGSIAQVPPSYSAKSVDGVRAYDAARRGEPLELAPVAVTVHEWDVRAIEERSLRAVITCSGGTYIRALARDLGRAAGSAAHLSALRRTRVGEFEIRDAFTLEQLSTDKPPLRALRVVTDG
jgi:tRNA pseudouridine55 synthase